MARGRFIDVDDLDLGDVITGRDEQLHIVESTERCGDRHHWRIRYVDGSTDIVPNGARFTDRRAG